jgi:thymidylate synthase
MTELDSATALAQLSALHAHKNRGYGNAWRKRGELLAIFTNLARKYDRLIIALDQGTDSTDERLIDTAGDLCVYAAKYLTWLAERAPEAFNAVSSVGSAECADDGGSEAADRVLGAVLATDGDVDQCWAALKAAFEPLEAGLSAQIEAPEPPLSWERKVELAWAVAGASVGLAVALANERPAELGAWRAEIEAMG